jgi:hypothetical protein
MHRFRESLEATTDSPGEWNEADLHPHDAGRRAVAELNGQSVDSAELTLVAIDELLVEHIAKEMHVSRP